jgi:hypothetical protein
VWSEVKVHTDGHVVYKKALYSVPFKLVGKQLWLKVTDTVVQAFHRHELVATHPRLRKPGDRHTVREHQPPEAQAWLAQDPQWCLARAKDIGPACHAVILAMFNNTVLMNLRGAQGIVRLREKVGDARLNAACERARVLQPPLSHHQDDPRQGARQRGCGVINNDGAHRYLPKRWPLRPRSSIPPDPLSRP